MPQLLERNAADRTCTDCGREYRGGAFTRYCPSCRPLRPRSKRPKLSTEELSRRQRERQRASYRIHGDQIRASRRAKYRSRRARAEAAAHDLAVAHDLAAVRAATTSSGKSPWDGYVKPSQPTETPAGTRARVAVYAARFEAGEALFHPADFSGDAD
jgi:hypothetical protein